MPFAEKLTLSNGVEVPQIGWGTWQLSGKTFKNAVRTATGCGYRLIDAARDYRNEKDLGAAIKKSNIIREDLFICTKIGNSQQRTGNISTELAISLDSLRISYLDLWLMHWPLPDYFLDTWKQMEDLYLIGKVRAIGVCNFKKRHLEELFASARVKPMVNQIEVHPLYSNKELIQFCQKHNIQVEAYCPLGLMDARLTNSEILNTLARKYHKTIAQVILKWEIQQGVIPIPKSGSEARQKENIDLFDFTLSPNELASIDRLNINYKFYIESVYCPGY